MKVISIFYVARQIIEKKKKKKKKSLSHAFNIPKFYSLLLYYYCPIPSSAYFNSVMYYFGYIGLSMFQPCKALMSELGIGKRCRRRRRRKGEKEIQHNNEFVSN